MEQIEASNTVMYKEFTQEDLYKFLGELTPEYSQSKSRNMVIHTGREGMDHFDVIFTIASDEAVLTAIAPGYKNLPRKCDTLQLPIEEIHKFLHELEI